jgi:DNA-nicking Smr family endonuclease
MRQAFEEGLSAEFHTAMMGKPKERARRTFFEEILPAIEPRLQRDFRVLSDSAVRMAGCEPGFDLDILKKLESGGLPYTAMLDLHGHTADAFIHLFDWLREAVREEHRVVLVICGKGKGYGEKGDMGLLKSQMTEWLARHPYVMAYATAQPRDGGGGALYVYLRRARF